MILSQAYPFVLANEEARASLTVTAEQQWAIDAAKGASDTISYMIFGGLACLIIISVAWYAFRPSHSIGFLTMLISILVGVIAGALGGAIGNWIRMSPSFHLEDPMMYQFARLMLLMSPLAASTGFMTGNFPKERAAQSTHIVGALIGLALALAIYSLLLGAVTPIEGRELVLPNYLANRLLLMSLVTIGIGTGILLAGGRDDKNGKIASTQEDGENAV